MHKKIYFIILIYIILILVLAVFGFTGDGSKETAGFASKYFSQTEIGTGISIFRHRLPVSTLYSISVILFLLYLSSGGTWQKIIKKYLGCIRSEYAVFFISLLALYYVLALLRFPFALYNGFFIGKKYGLLNTDLITWSLRYLSSSAIFNFLLCALILIFALVIRKTKRHIFYIPLVFILFGMLYIYIYPRYITPLFYKTERLANSELENKIKGLFSRSGLRIQDIYVIKTSAVHNSVNAYMIGTGPTRRVVLYDTLLDKFSDDEILSIIAHEAGHYSEEHMTLGLIIGALGIMLVLFLMNRASCYLTGSDIKSLFRADIIPLLLILFILFSFIATPAGNAISRYMENRADAFSLRVAGNPNAYINLTVRLAKTNKSSITPNRIYSAFYSTHPDILDRIKRAENFKTNMIHNSK